MQMLYWRYQILLFLKGDIFMEPIALQIGSFCIRWYGVMTALGFLCAGWILNRNRKYANMTSDQITNIMIISIVSGIVGARIFYFIQFYHLYHGQWWKIIRVDQGGLVFYGGFILSFISLLIYAKIQKLDAVRILDLCTPAIAVGHAFGRVGCFLNGCCYGKPTDWIWGVTYPTGSAPAIQCGSVPLHPIQLVEAGENLLASMLYCWLLRHCKRGVTISTYMIIYGFLRCINEFMRGDNVFYLRYFTPAQLIGLVLIPLGSAMLLWFGTRQTKKEEQA